MLVYDVFEDFEDEGGEEYGAIVDGLFRLPALKIKVTFVQSQSDGTEGLHGDDLEDGDDDGYGF